MVTDQKIEEILQIVREERERNDTRFSKLESRDDELLKMMIEERALNNSRFTQLATGLMDVRKEVGKLNVDLNAKIDKVYDSLSQDIQVFAQDLHHVKKRVTKLEKHFSS